jgi:hypothetical protein
MATIDPSHLREHMPVLGSDGEPVGTVDGVEGGHIKLTRDGGPEHHFLPLAQVAELDGGAVRLALPAAEAKRMWRGEGAPGVPGSDAAGQPVTQGQRTLAGRAAAEAGAAGAGAAGGTSETPTGQSGGMPDLSGDTPTRA